MDATVLAQKSEAPAIDKVARALEEDIALGRLKPRERLVEEELIHRFGVKRHVIRQVLVDLEAMGIIVRQPNKGAAVKDFTSKEVEDLYAVREVLEKKGAELIPLPADPDFIEILAEIHRRHSVAAAAGQLRVVFRENLLFHRTFYAACGNPSLAQAIEQFALKTHAIRSYAIGDSRLLMRVCDEHAAIIEALRSADRRQLTRLVVQHLRPAKDAYLRISSRLDD
jgi:DNA-binding GntR family transcriptional regulator